MGGTALLALVGRLGFEHKFATDASQKMLVRYRTDNTQLSIEFSETRAIHSASDMLQLPAVQAAIGIKTVQCKHAQSGWQGLLRPNGARDGRPS
jgi:hypothetical protein